MQRGGGASGVAVSLLVSQVASWPLFDPGSSCLEKKKKKALVQKFWGNIHHSLHSQSDIPHNHTVNWVVGMGVFMGGRGTWGLPVV